jgi:putative ABC transport system permease protein
VYLPMVSQMGGGGSRSWTVVLRARTNAETLVAPVRAELRGFDPLMLVTEVRTYDEIIGDATSRVSLTAVLLLFSAVAALILGSIGVFGVISYVTSQRVTELAVRQALGAAPRQILVAVVGHAALLAGLGLLIGSVLAASVSGSLRTLIYGIEAVDPVSFLIGSAVLAGAALAAAIVPAIRVFRLSPAESMRAE